MNEKGRKICLAANLAPHPNYDASSEKKLTYTFAGDLLEVFKYRKPVFTLVVGDTYSLFVDP